MGLGGAAAKIVAVPVQVLGGAANSAGEAGTAVIVGTNGAVTGVIEGASGAGVKVIKGARKAATGVTSAAVKLLRKTGSAVNDAFTMHGGKRNRTNKNRKNKD